MKRLALLAAPALLAAGTPLAAQLRTASIGVSATVAEPVHVEAPVGVRLDYRPDGYLDVTTPAALPGARGYLVDVVVSRAEAPNAAEAATPAPADVPRAAPATRLPGRDGRYRIDLRESALPEGEHVRVTYVVATNL